MSEVPFPLHKDHKSITKTNWIKKYGMNIDDDDFDYIYDMYIHATHCDLCGKKFLTSLDRQLDHDHTTGEVRNIVCNKCNSRKEDRVSNTNTGLKYICKLKNNKCTNGYTYNFQIMRNGKHIIRKSSVDLDKLVKFRDEFLKNNNIYS